MKIILRLFISLIICLSLSGCWSAKELTDITLATALAIDKDENNEYKVTIQVVNPSEVAGDQISSRSSVATYSATGRTMFEAVRKITKISPRKVHLSHLQILVYGEEFAREGIGETLDFLIRDHGFRTDFTIAIAKGLTAEDLVSVLTPLEKIPAQKIASSIESSQDNWAPSKEVLLNELIESVSSEGKDAILTGIYVQGDPDEGKSMQNVESADAPAKVRLDAIGVFSGDKLLGWLNEDQSKGFNYITNNISSTVGWVNCGDGDRTITLEVINSETKIKGSIKNGKPEINLDLNIAVNVADVECSIDLTNTEERNEVEKKLEQKTVDLINDSVSAAKEYESDIFGFGAAIRRSDPQEWKNVKDNWATLFPETDVKANVTVQIEQSGMITTPIYNDIKKKTKEGN
ncbi:Ger(x)C family spore germination protein [Gracilibacillus oryzae]|uniref:Ger(X)C family spore germination protein n=1 Tax=Gracilibacillus oryzae TaxID=1672701 RepID=A0A7C8KSM0_9BACI|nr:Ger(x)C family spore germination protein [Gracilibacillus oryzae]KAB8137722.1 Ger(x)C family spore germination protein [Gracilibacillus oryzae]